MKDVEEGGAISFQVSILRLPRSGMPVVIEADEAQRAALAQAHGLLSVERFRADLLVAPWKRNGVNVTGHVRASITQQCVVTLDPLPARVDEEVSNVFLPADSKLGRQGIGEGGEIHLDPDGPDAPETFTGEVIDVGAIVEEVFGLGIDLYPRKSGVALAAGGDEDDEVSALPEGPLQEKLRKLMRKE